MCAGRFRLALHSECLELSLVTAQLVGNPPAQPLRRSPALLSALEEVSCITELMVSHCSSSSTGELMLRPRCHQ